MTETPPPYDGTPYVEPRTDTFISRSITFELTDEEIKKIGHREIERTLFALMAVADRVEEHDFTNAEKVTRITISAEGIKQWLLNA